MPRIESGTLVTVTPSTDGAGPTGAGYWRILQTDEAVTVYIAPIGPAPGVLVTIDPTDTVAELLDRLREVDTPVARALFGEP